MVDGAYSNIDPLYKNHRQFQFTVIFSFNKSRKLKIVRDIDKFYVAFFYGTLQQKILID